MRVQGTVALVTGASSGIGAATAKLLTRAGSQVLACGRDAGRLRSLAANGADILVGDLAERGAGQALAERALQRYGRVDILVINAGMGWAGPVATMPDQVIDQLLAINLHSPIVLTRSLVPSMRRQGWGHVVLVSSIAGRLGVGGEAVYAASKAGLDVFGQSLRQELAGENIPVSVVVPGSVQTEFFARRGQPYLRRRPKPLPPEQVAAALVNAIARRRADVYVPRWLRLPVAVQGLLPGAYRRLAGRFG